MYFMSSNTPQDPITEEQRLKQKMRHRFVMQFLRYGHEKGGITKAALAAGYSPNSAASQGSRLMMDPEIKEAIQFHLDRRNERMKNTPDRIIAELMKIAYADMSDIATWEANQIDIRDALDLDPDVTATIAEISETKIKGGGRKIVIKQHDKMRALELLGKTLCIFKDKDADKPHQQVGGVLRVPGRLSVEEWEQEQGLVQAQQDASEEP